MMAVETAPGVTQRMLPNGRLELVCGATRSQVECEPVAAAMWIALKQAGGDLDRAAAMLADVWGTDLGETRYDLTRLAGTLCSAGLLTEI